MKNPSNSHASDITSQAGECALQYCVCDISVSETRHVLRYNLHFRYVLLLDGAKIRSFIETTKLFLRKIIFFRNFTPKNLHNTFFYRIFAAEKYINK
nr:MAG TPA: hypothetical protein [Caudoviricetes sp.]